jgi:hypothetical protein
MLIFLALTKINDQSINTPSIGGTVLLKSVSGMAGYMLFEINKS